MNIKKILQHQRKFVRARQWEEFHTPKNLAAALSVEALELLEIFQWHRGEEDNPENLDASTKIQVQEEMADVFYYLLRLSDVMGLDLEQAYWSKMKKNAKKYPVHLAKGNSKKYSQLKKSKS